MVSSKSMGHLLLQMNRVKPLFILWEIRQTGHYEVIKGKCRLGWKKDPLDNHVISFIWQTSWSGCHVEHVLKYMMPHVALPISPIFFPLFLFVKGKQRRNLSYQQQQGLLQEDDNSLLLLWQPSFTGGARHFNHGIEKHSSFQSFTSPWLIYINLGSTGLRWSCYVWKIAEEEESTVNSSLSVPERQGVCVYEHFWSILDKRGPLNSLRHNANLGAP